MQIGNYNITDKEIDQYIATLAPEQQMYKDVPAFREQVKSRLEEISLFAMEGEEKHLDDTEEYKNTLSVVRRDVLGQLAMAEIINDVDVTDEEVKDYYENHKEQFGRPASVSASHILVDSEDRCNEIKSEIENGGKSFEDAAKEYSTCPSGKSGGSLGTFGKGQMVKEFEDASFNGELNKILGPVKTKFGYHLIRVDEREDASVMPFEQVADKVKAAAKRAKQQTVYDENVARLRAKFVR